MRRLCLALLLCAGAFAQTKSRPTYEVLRATRPIQVDGRLDEADWTSAKPVGAFVNTRDGSASPIRTEAKLLYDDRFLYFAFRNTDENIWATMKQRDAHLWEE